MGVAMMPAASTGQEPPRRDRIVVDGPYVRRGPNGLEMNPQPEVAPDQIMVTWDGRQLPDGRYGPIGPPIAPGRSDTQKIIDVLKARGRGMMASQNADPRINAKNQAIAVQSMDDAAQLAANQENAQQAERMQQQRILGERETELAKQQAQLDAINSPGFMQNRAFETVLGATGDVKGAMKAVEQLRKMNDPLAPQGGSGVEQVMERFQDSRESPIMVQMLGPAQEGEQIQVRPEQIRDSIMNPNMQYSPEDIANINQMISSQEQLTGQNMYGDNFWNWLWGKDPQVQQIIDSIRSGNQNHSAIRQQAEQARQQAKEQAQKDVWQQMDGWLP